MKIVAHNEIELLSFRFLFSFSDARDQQGQAPIENQHTPSTGGDYKMENGSRGSFGLMI